MAATSANDNKLYAFCWLERPAPLLDILLLTGLKLLGSSTLAANTSAFALATLYNFGASRWWTYAGAYRKPVRTQFAQFVTLSLIGLLLNDLIVVALETLIEAVLQDGSWSYLHAKAIATAAVAIWSFVTNRSVTFSDR